MSTYLTLFHIRSEDLRASSFAIARATFHLSQDYELYGHFIDMSAYRDRLPEIPVEPTVKSRELPAGLTIELGVANGEGLAEDRYGEALRFATAGEIGRKIPPALVRGNHAVFAYLAALQPNTPIVLYPH